LGKRIYNPERKQMADRLQQGIAALKAGNKEQARQLLIQATQANPQNEQAWLWLSGAVESDSERLICLNKVLEINPNNEPAQRGAAALHQRGATPADSSSVPQHDLQPESVEPPADPYSAPPLNPVNSYYATLSEREESLIVPDTAPQFQSTQPQSSVSQMQLEGQPPKLETDQSLLLGIFGGLGGMVIGAVLWAVITLVTDYQIGWMAVGVGFLVGAGVRFLGRGTSNSFQVVGGALALIGCLLGNLLTVLVMASQEFAIPLLDLLTNLSIGLVFELMKATFSPIDLLFYGFAIWSGYRYSRAQVANPQASRPVR
jgi:hypothetical protein